MIASIMTLLVVLNASVFGIGGLGEDQSVFQTPFLDRSDRARIQITVNPEFCVLNEGSDFRALYWTNPFNFGITVPVARDWSLGAGIRSRFGQGFDVYLEESPLTIHLDSRGGVEEFHGAVSRRFGIAEIALSGAYLFGGAREVWAYTMNDYVSIDTFTYGYHGQIFSAGIGVGPVMLAYEGLGRLSMQRTAEDTTWDLPDRVTVGLRSVAGPWWLFADYEHSFWSGTASDGHDFDSPHRFQLGVRRGSFSLAYGYNPWYLGTTEHRLNTGISVGVHELGSIALDCGFILRLDGAVREFDLKPRIRFTLEELFARRRK